MRERTPAPGGPTAHGPKVTLPGAGAWAPCWRGLGDFIASTAEGRRQLSSTGAGGEGEGEGEAEGAAEGATEGAHAGKGAGEAPGAGAGAGAEAWWAETEARAIAASVAATPGAGRKARPAPAATASLA